MEKNKQKISLRSEPLKRIDKFRKDMEKVPKFKAVPVFENEIDKQYDKIYTDLVLFSEMLWKERWNNRFHNKYSLC